MGLGVTGTYAMQALRSSARGLISLGGRTAMLLLMIYLLHHMGLQGLATARVCYGSTALLVYLPLLFRPGMGRRNGRRWRHPRRLPSRFRRARSYEDHGDGGILFAGDIRDPTPCAQYGTVPFACILIFRVCILLLHRGNEDSGVRGLSL